MHDDVVAIRRVRKPLSDYKQVAPIRKEKKKKLISLSKILIEVFIYPISPSWQECDIKSIFKRSMNLFLPSAIKIVRYMTKFNGNKDRIQIFLLH